jgi:hypothetical protein
MMTFWKKKSYTKEDMMSLYVDGVEAGIEAVDHVGFDLSRVALAIWKRDYRGWAARGYAPVFLGPVMRRR